MLNFILTHSGYFCLFVFLSSLYFSSFLFLFFFHINWLLLYLFEFVLFFFVFYFLLLLLIYHRIFNSLNINLPSGLSYFQNIPFRCCIYICWKLLLLGGVFLFLKWQKTLMKLNLLGLPFPQSIILLNSVFLIFFF